MRGMLKHCFLQQEESLNTLGLDWQQLWSCSIVMCNTFSMKSSLSLFHSSWSRLNEWQGYGYYYYYLLFIDEKQYIHWGEIHIDVDLLFEWKTVLSLRIPHLDLWMKFLENLSPQPLKQSSLSRLFWSEKTSTWSCCVNFISSRPHEICKSSIDICFANIEMALCNSLFPVEDSPSKIMSVSLVLENSSFWLRNEKWMERVLCYKMKPFSFCEWGWEPQERP